MPQLDAISVGDVTIDTYHERIHSGRAFVWSKLYGAVANSGFARVIAEVASGSSAHAQFRGAVDAKAVVYFRSLGSFSNVTTETNLLNRNFFSTKVPSLAMWSGGSLEVTSASPFSQLMPAGSRNQAVGGVDGSFAEVILAPASIAWISRTCPARHKT